MKRPEGYGTMETNLTAIWRWIGSGGSYILAYFEITWICTCMVLHSHIRVCTFACLARDQTWSFTIMTKMWPYFTGIGRSVFPCLFICCSFCCELFYNQSSETNNKWSCQYFSGSVIHTCATKARKHFRKKIEPDLKWQMLMKFVSCWAEDDRPLA